ncbi:nucleotidyltransferase family protein [Sphingobium sp. AR-3-1]|uniref:Nucleotidyltransferase family protein n=1 Tax=Sphingobium psychrophilum TaxID=2728834 RepID=A0A7X9X092_9SPHN|nr:nucleotidyltransferase family protein [Sphingobium psychrophilum]NML13070.1 nucleotidyltransferase family protein [Sphingobium psychrophilum]
MKPFKRPSADDRDRLTALVLGHPYLASIIARWQELALPDCWLSGSAIAQARWNEAFGFPAAHGIADVDLVFFDASDLSEEAEVAHAARIGRIFADMPVRIDLKNQARVHLWYEGRFGYAIPPYDSAAQAIATFPTTSAAIGVQPGVGGLDIITPFGLADLFAPVVRPNRAQITEAIYEAKLARWKALWPDLQAIDW